MRNYAHKGTNNNVGVLLIQFSQRVYIALAPDVVLPLNRRIMLIGLKYEVQQKNQQSHCI